MRPKRRRPRGRFFRRPSHDVPTGLAPTLDQLAAAISPLLILAQSRPLTPADIRSAILPKPNRKAIGESIKSLLS